MGRGSIFHDGTSSDNNAELMKKVEMKGISVFIIAIALAFGLNQCRKPVLADFGQTKDITLTTDNAGSKGDFTQDGSELTFAWNENDKIYVYASPGNGGKFDEDNGHFAGIMDIVSIEGNNANFFGKVKVYKADEKFRFIHVGRQNTVNEDGSASIDFSVQDGMMRNSSNIGRRVVAFMDDDIKEGLQYSGKLAMQFIVAKFDFSPFIGRTAYMSGYTNNVLNISAKGKLQFTPGVTEVCLGEITDENKDYYLIVLPETAVKTYRFYCKNGDKNTNCYTRKVKFPNNGKFYNIDGAGNSINIVPDVLSGLFSVSANKQVHFTKGNLYWNGAEFAFEDNQYDCPFQDGASWNANHVFLLFYKNFDKVGESYEQWYAAGNQDWFFANTNVSPYETANEKFSVNGVSGKYRAPSASEMEYLISTRTGSIDGAEKSATQMYGTAKVAGKLGFVILPDEFNVPDGCTFEFGWTGFFPVASTYVASMTVKNEYTEKQWKDMEANGAVFLPVASFRNDGWNPYCTAEYSYFPYYWLSTPNGGYAYRMDFSSGLLHIEPLGVIGDAYPVRLICEDDNEGNGSATSFDSGTW